MDTDPNMGKRPSNNRDILDIYINIEASCIRFFKTAVFQWIFAIVVPLLAMLGFRYLYIYGGTRNRIPGCPTRTFLGVYCPGCGSGRALYHLLHLHIARAFGFNPFFVLMLPVVVYYSVKAYLDTIFARETLPGIKMSYNAFLAVIGLTLLYGILRNITIYPFNLLAPH